MVKHKKLTGFIIILFLIFITTFIFLEKIVQTAANKFLQPYNENFSAKVSSFDIDYSEASATLQFSAKNRETERNILNVDHIKLDYDFGDGLKIIIRDADAKLSKNTLAAFKKISEGKITEKDHQDNKKVELPSLGFLASVSIENVSLQHLDTKIKGTLESAFIDFNQGEGTIQDIRARYLPTNLTFFDLPSIELAFDEKVDAIINSPHITIGKQLMSGLKDLAPDKRQAQEAIEEKEIKKTAVSSSPLSLIGNVKVRDFKLEILDPQMNTKVDLMTLNMNEGQVSVKDVSASVDQTQLASVDSIELGFNKKGLMGEGDANLKVDLQGTSVNLQTNTLDKLKQLKELMPSDPQIKTDENKPSFLSQVSSLNIQDTNLTLQKQGVRTNIGDVEINLSGGKASVEDIKSFLAGTNTKILDVSKVSVTFDPEEVVGKEKPTISVIISDVHARLSKKIINQLKSKEKSSGEPLKLPVKISRILVSNSSVSFLDYPGIGKQKHLTIQDIFGSVYNVSAEPGTPLASFAFNATFEGESKLISEGSLDLADQPLQWSVDYRLFGLDMKKLNDELRARIPLTFTEGVFNFTGEAIKRDEKIVGYFKPVLDDASYIGNKDEYKGVRHFFAETFATFTNWLFEREETETVATRVPFVFEDGKMNTKVGEAVWSTIEHGLLETDRIEPGVENKHQLKEAQEEKPQKR